MVAEAEAALDAGAFGLSSGLIYAPGMHAPPPRSRPSSPPPPVEAACTRRTCATRPTGCPRRWTSRSPRSCRGSGRPRSRSRTSRPAPLGSGAGQPRPSRGSRPPAPRASTSRPTSTRTPPPPRRWPRSCRPPCSALGVDDCVAALREREVRDRIRDLEASGHLWLGERGQRPRLGRHHDLVRGQPSRVGRPVAGRAGRETEGGTPPTLAFDALIDDRLAVHVVLDCMSEHDVETILAVPWIAVCTDAEGRRPDHPILGRGARTRAPTGARPRVLGRTSASAASRARDRGRQADRPCRPRGSGCATAGSSARAPLQTSSCSTRRPSPMRPPTAPGRYPIGIEHVIVNGRPAILAGAETGERPGRLLRRARRWGATPRPWHHRPVTATETPAIARLPGGPPLHPATIAAVARPSRGDPSGPGCRGHRATRPGRRGWARPERPSDVPRRARAVAPPPPRRSPPATRLAPRRPGRGGCPFRGDLHRLASSPAPPGARRSRSNGSGR